MPKHSKQPNLQHLRHSLAHLLAASVLELYPGAQNAIGPAIEDGFYQDFELPKPISEEDLPKIEKKMREMLPTWKKILRRELTPAQARKEVAWNKYKLEMVNDLIKAKKPITFYLSGKFLDLCRGGHVANARNINPDAFKLTKVAGAYWRGDEKNPMLTRIYGLAFATKKELDNHLKMLEEAQKRDHKKLGVDLDLFTFSELVGPGLPLFTPKGTIIRDLLDDFVWDLRKRYGYQKVDIPHITKKELYETSGHWDKFKKELFRIKTREGHEFALKPMNCPHHIQIFARKKWSFRELPQRYASTTKIYRDEQTGELSGLVRVRSITQDDAHVFCNMAKTESEIKYIWDIIQDFYAAFRLPLRIQLSLRDPKNPEKYLGNEKIWADAEAILREVAKEKGRKVKEVKGEAAFYGPKLDFMATDSLGREWQVATIQVDLNMPKQFELHFTRDDGTQGNIYMLHAAIMGSIERFLAILIEHFAGAFPLWLAPVQVAILPISDELNKYARIVEKRLRMSNMEYRISIDDRSESIGKKIREAELQKIPYMLIVGKKEQEQNTVSVRQRGERDLGAMKLEKFAKKIRQEIETKSI